MNTKHTDKQLYTMQQAREIVVREIMENRDLLILLWSEFDREHLAATETEVLTKLNRNAYKRN